MTFVILVQEGGRKHFHQDISIKASATRHAIGISNIVEQKCLLAGEASGMGTKGACGDLSCHLVVFLATDGTSVISHIAIV